jgi:hypothetical protein
MDLADLFARLGRRWLATALGIVATAVLVQYVYGIVPQDYESRASMVLLPPATALDKTTNPYLGLSGLQAITDVLSRSLSDGAVHETLAPKDGTATLQVYRDTSATGPMLVIDVMDTTSEGARAVLTRTIDAAPSVLDKLQTSVGVAPGEEIRIVEVTRSIEPTASNKAQIRALILAGVGGLGLTLFAASLLDNVLTRRSRRRTTAASDGARTEAIEGTESPLDEDEDDEPAHIDGGGGDHAPVGTEIAEGDHEPEPGARDDNKRDDADAAGQKAQAPR